MKKFTLMRSLLSLLLAIPMAVSCYDDTDIQNKIDILVDKVYSIEQRINSEFTALHAMLDGNVLISDISINATTNVTTLTLTNGETLQLLPKTDLKSFVTYLSVGGVDYWAYVNADGTKELFKDAAGQPVPVQTDVPEVVVEDGDYYIHIDGIPSGYTYDPNADTTNKNNKNVEIKLIELKPFTGDGTSTNPIIVSEGAVNVTYEGAGQAYMKYYSFTPTSNGTYSIKSLAMDKLALNAIDPYIGFLGTETDMSKIDTSGNGDGKNINFTHTFTAEAGVSYTFIIFVSSASRYPASFDIVISCGILYRM